MTEEPRLITYTLRELTEVMIRDKGIHSGLWMVWTKFNFGVSNIMRQNEAGENETGPGVISQLTEVGLQTASEPGPLVVDAAEVWKSSGPNRAQRRAARQAGS